MPASTSVSIPLTPDTAYRLFCTYLPPEWIAERNDFNEAVVYLNPNERPNTTADYSKAVELDTLVAVWATLGRDAMQLIVEDLLW